MNCKGDGEWQEDPVVAKENKDREEASVKAEPIMRSVRLNGRPWALAHWIRTGTTAASSPASSGAGSPSVVRWTYAGTHSIDRADAESGRRSRLRRFSKPLEAPPPCAIASDWPDVHSRSRPWALQRSCY